MKLPELYRTLWEDRKTNDERECEFTWTYKHLSNGKILDIGCCETYFCEVLYKLGYNITGVDIRDYFGPRKDTSKGNWTFIKGSILDSPFKENTFDQVTAISTIEHIGLNCYDQIQINENGDRQSLEQMYRLAKPNGTLLVTLPFGNNGENGEWMRYYNIEKLSELFRGYRWKPTFYRRENKQWQISDPRKAEKRETGKGGLPRAVVCVKVDVIK